MDRSFCSKFRWFYSDPALHCMFYAALIKFIPIFIWAPRSFSLLFWHFVLSRCASSTSCNCRSPEPFNICFIALILIVTWYLQLKKYQKHITQLNLYLLTLSRIWRFCLLVLVFMHQIAAKAVVSNTAPSFLNGRKDPLLACSYTNMNVCFKAEASE